VPYPLSIGTQLSGEAEFQLEYYAQILVSKALSGAAFQQGLGLSSQGCWALRASGVFLRKGIRMMNAPEVVRPRCVYCSGRRADDRVRRGKFVGRLDDARAAERQRVRERDGPPLPSVVSFQVDIIGPLTGW